MRQRRNAPRGSGISVEPDAAWRVPNVRLKIADISRRLLAHSNVLIDLLEVASYVYAADSAIPRGGRTDAQMGAHWRRKLRFVIPVRLPELWSSEPVRSALVETLSFLSDDEYELEFSRLEDPPALAEYFEFSGADTIGFTPDDVILFSGGLDFLPERLSSWWRSNKKVALVSHRSASKIAGAQARLVHEMAERFGTERVLHVPVWANLAGDVGKEPTHRTRSFLFAALGTVTARLFESDHISFFENRVSA